MTTRDGRIKELDGLRGLAILLVVGFHYYSARPDLLPYGNAFSNFPVFKCGFLGVELFFMVSGYVIFMSLDASQRMADFARKRWLRLFPAMLISTAGVMLTAWLLPERPLGVPRVQDLVPGLTFIEARWYRAVLGIDVADLEGAFWSLYVEVRFYVMACALYFLVGRRSMVAGLAALVVATSTAKLLVFRLGFAGPVSDAVLYILSEVLIGQHLAWFVLGMVVYMHTKGQLGRRGLLAVALAAGFSLLHMHADKLQVAVALLLIVIFLSVTLRGRMKLAFNSRLLTYFGMISYPLYLFHENAGIALIIKGSALPWIPAPALPILVLCVMAAIAHFIAVELEPRLRALLRKLASAAWLDRPHWFSKRAA